LATSLSAAEVEVFTAVKAMPRRAETVASRITEQIPQRAVAVAPDRGASVQESPAKAAAPKRAIAVSKPRSPQSLLKEASAKTAKAERATVVPAKPQAAAEFTFKDRNGKTEAAPIVDRYQERRIVYPLAKIDPRINPKLARAASIAQERAHAHSKSRCWHYVKNALLASGIISSYPKTAYAKQAGEELVRDFGFKKLSIRDPYKAPVGAVLVYGGRRAAGHVEIRTKTGFVSDFQNKKPSHRPLIGIYAKA
jgi:hypothetical protein